MAKAKKKNVNVNYILLGVAALLIIVGVVIALTTGKDDKENGKNKGNGKEITSTETTVEEEYGFTKEDAIDVIKNIYKSDSYVFEAELREDNMYVVTVSNPDTDTTYKYVVNPNDSSFTEIK